MRSIFYFVPIFASHAFAMESLNSGQANVLDKRQTTDYCGMDVYGNDLFCINSLCCESADAWSCYGPDDQCCVTGYTCLSGSQCYLDTSGDQLCLQGSATVTGGTGNTPQTSAGSGTPTSTKAAVVTPTTAPAATPKSDGAGELDRVANNLAKMLGLTGAAALLLV